jgi:DNA-binding Lrp family transcriptional regulator
MRLPTMLPEPRRRHHSPHPDVRAEVLRVLATGPRTTVELAASIGRSRVSVHYFAANLAAAGVVERVGVRPGVAAVWALRGQP